jgi:hypothetical protein
LEPDDAYLSACASVAFDSPRRTRNELPWSADQRARILAAVDQHDFLSSYALEDAP